MYIESPLRLPLLTIEWIFTIILLELGLFFLLRYARQRKQYLTHQELGYSVLFFSLCGMWGNLILADYYAAETLVTPFFIWTVGSMRELFLNIGALSLMIGVTFFCFSLEKYYKFWLKKYFFTGCFFILLVASLSSFFFNLYIAKYLSLLIFPLFLIFLGFYYVAFFKIGLRKTNVSIEILKHLPPFVLITIGFLITSDLLFNPANIELRITTSSLQLVSIIILSYLTIKLPNFAEFDWRRKVEDLYLINTAGVCIFHRSFTHQLDFMDEHLKSGAIASINIILKSLTPSQKQQKRVTIKKAGKIINIYTGELTSGILISDEELSSIMINLEKFVQKIETIYYNVLLRWSGETDVFAPVEAIANEFFP